MQLSFYEQKYQAAVNNYTLTEEQLLYTGSPQESLELQQKDSGRHAILAMEKDELVTFFVLHKGEGAKPYISGDKTILIRGFSTDFHQQGKGYAKQALMQLPDFVRTHFPEVNEMVLAVNKRNVAAQNLYKKCGYLDEGDRLMGKKGELIIMSFKLY